MEVATHPKFLELLRGYWQSEEKQEAATVLAKPDKREIDSIAQLFTAIAIDCLGDNPRSVRSPIPKEIADLASQLGMSITDDTVRKYLKLGGSFIAEGWERRRD